MESWGKGPWLVGLSCGAVFLVLADAISGGYESRSWWATALWYVCVLSLAFAVGAKIDGWRKVGQRKRLDEQALPENVHTGDLSSEPPISTGIYIKDSKDVTVTGSRIRGMDRGIVSENSSDVRLNDNDIA